MDASMPSARPPLAGGCGDAPQWVPGSCRWQSQLWVVTDLPSGQHHAQHPSGTIDGGVGLLGPAPTTGPLGVIIRLGPRILRFDEAEEIAATLSEGFVSHNPSVVAAVSRLASEISHSVERHP